MSRPPGASSVARRLLVLERVVIYASDPLPRELRAWLAEDGLVRYLSPVEREWLHDIPVLQQRINASWRIEALQVLMWALKLLPELPPYDTQAGYEILEAIPSDARAFVRSAKLRRQSILEIWA